MAGRKDRTSKQVQREGGMRRSKDSERQGAQATPGSKEKQRSGTATENEAQQRERNDNDMSSTEDMD